MKKAIFLILLGFGSMIFLLGFSKVWAQSDLSPTPDITFTFNKTNAKVGETIEVRFLVEKFPSSGKIVKLTITDPVSGSDYVKKEYTDVPTAGSDYTWVYDWDTKTAQSNPGQHEVRVNILDKDRYSIYQESTFYNLSAADSTINNGADDQNQNNNQNTTDNNPPADDSKKSVEGFNLGKLGTVTFLPTKINDAKELIMAIINWLLSLLGALAVVAIVYSGLMYITAGSDTAKSENAKKNLTWAIIGIVVIMVSFVLVTIVNQIILGK